MGHCKRVRAVEAFPIMIGANRLQTLDSMMQSQVAKAQMRFIVAEDAVASGQKYLFNRLFGLHVCCTPKAAVV